MARYGKILIVGAGGNLARAVGSAAPPGAEVIRLTHADLDITEDDALAQALARTQPDLVINGAAYNLVDLAESEPEAALRLNTLGPSLLARECTNRGITLVHFSTDFVFDGYASRPYTETDLAVPLGVYGATKLMGETAVQQAAPQHYVIRVSRLFGPVPVDKATGKPSGNFPLLMLNLARERTSVRVVNDQVGSPSYTLDLARAVWELLDNGSGGLFHLSNDGEVSFADYARTVFEITGVSCEVEDVSSEEYGAPAQRPPYSTLSNAKAQAQGVTPLRHWREALEEFLGERSLNGR